MTYSELVVKNTVEGIKADLAKGKRTLKKIAAECTVMAQQVEPEFRDYFEAMSQCKTRREFDSFISLVA